MTARDVHLSDWLERAAAVPPAERAALLAVPVTTPSTTVAPELADAMLALRTAVDRLAKVRRARSFAWQRCRYRAAFRLDRIWARRQLELEAALERVEMLVAGRAGR